MTLATILFVVVILVLLCGLSVFRWLHNRLNQEPKEVNLLDQMFINWYRLGQGSRVAISVADEYRKIPSKYRPFEPNELARTLTALDIKWGDRADDHYYFSYFSETREVWMWHCRCCNSGWYLQSDGIKRCKLWDDYGRLFWEFHEITKAAKAQEREFKLAGLVEVDPEHLNRLLTRARAESDIIQTVTKELLGEPVGEDKSEEITGKAILLAQKVRDRIGVL